jgi:hypothetical protein
MRRKHLPFRPRLEALEDRCLPSTLTVTTNQDTATPGSLRAEIAAAQSGDTIVFDPSLNGQTIALSGNELVLNKSLNINGPGAGQLTIDGSNLSRVFEVDGASTTVTLSGLTISHGAGLAEAEPAFSEGWMPSPYDGLGGGVLNFGKLTVNGCVFSGNSTSSNVNSYGGGGIYNDGTLAVSGCTFSHNSVGNSYSSPGGGGIFNVGTLSVSSSTFSNNVAYGGGGAIGNTTSDIGNGFAFAFVGPGSLTVSGSTFSGNSATNGGGLYNASSATATVTGSTLSGNSATNGGGVYNAGTLTLSGCTLSGNTAASDGGGIFNAKHGQLTLLSSVVLHNLALLGADLYNLGGVKISKDSTVGGIGP